MPPMRLLANDTKFYGKAKPQGEALPIGILKSDQSSNPTTPMIRYRTKTAQENAEKVTTNQINNPDSKNEVQKDLVREIENENLQGVNNVKEYVDDEKSLGKRFTEFLQGEIVETTPNQKKQQQERELGRIGVGSNEPSGGEIRPVGEVPKVAAQKIKENTLDPIINFASEKGTQIVIGLIGVYLIGQFLSGVGEGRTKRGKKD